MLSGGCENCTKKDRHKTILYPMHKQPCLESKNFQRPTLPNAEKLATSGFYLPSGITITEGQIEKIVSLIDS